MTTSPERESSAGTDGPHLEQAVHRARFLAAGVISGGVVHEFANLLTIVDGLRQMAALGIRTENGLESVAGPADKCLGLVEAFRHVFSKPAAGPSTGLSMARELEVIGILLGARLRGRATRIVVIEPDRSLILNSSSAVAVRFAFLCVILALLEHGRSDGRYPQELELTAAGADGYCRAIEARLSGLGRAPGSSAVEVTGHDLTTLANTIAESVRARLVLDENHATNVVRVILQMPA